MRKKPSQPAEPARCAWRTGLKHCRMRPSGRYCSWHHHWLRMVEVGSLGKTQHEAFAEWWEQFQPYGSYGHAQTPWWADRELLWLVVSGEQDQPAKTIAMDHELEMRRAEVQAYKYGLYAQANQWPRVSGLPLPSWDEAEWKQKIDGSFPSIKQCG